ncbi:hypothetical protein [Pontibacter sp. SGAir0037]|uniref:hypothetical protein n=1 Tax=Pontibacter sp. SGAir0037 TaxID=2571030 RepID=UPI0010CD16D5|nr:hypothetical protein [Pontibacter sp. SGAir0037]QCR21481.1 hypothetical protein C1N53_03380 [Pontibacter sp. SGAir0037]
MKKTLLSLSLLLGLQLSSHAQVTLSDMQNWRPNDKRGIHVFETSKQDTVVYEGLKLRLGGSFTQQFQMLQHSNTASAVLNSNEQNLNQLITIGNGFNLATANLNFDVALADGIRLNLVTYLSSRHHPETWVKGGYIQVDKLGFLNNAFADKLMEHVTLRVGHMEINYGDAHFRRTDNAQAMYNPFVGNYIMDAFTTEIGGEVIYQNKGFLALAAITGGEIQGGITKPDQRAASYYGKVGYDNLVADNLRVRLTGSFYTTSSSASNTLYGGDRAGSRYYLVMENQLATTSAQAFSGRFNPGFTDKVTALVVNPFVKYHGLELFGNLERAKGRSAAETSERTWDQVGADVVYRFGNSENFYVAGRYNKVQGTLATVNTKAEIERQQIGAGWFATRNILAKVEYVQQRYYGFPGTDIRHGGKFDGFMVEGVISF